MRRRSIASIEAMSHTQKEKISVAIFSPNEMLDRCVFAVRN
jgi:hypothetical protein